MFHLSIDISVAIDARKILAMTVKKFEDKMRADRVSAQLQLLREQKMSELFSRLHPEIERLARIRVNEIAHTPIGNILSVTATPTEIKVSRKEQIEALIFNFDLLTREVQINFEGDIHYHRVLRVEISASMNPFLTDQRLPGEPFVPTNLNKLPEIVNDSIDALLGTL